jgi:hypothetical protein
MERERSRQLLIVAALAALGALLMIVGPSPAPAASQPRFVRTVELHSRSNETVALELRVSRPVSGRGPQVFAFRAADGLVVAAQPTARRRLWRIGPNTHGATHFLTRLRNQVAAGGTPKLTAGVKHGVPLRFELRGFDQRIHGVPQIRCRAGMCLTLPSRV